MSTYAEVVNNLRNIYSNGISADDYNIEDEQLLFMFNYYRALFIKRELDKGAAINSNLVQDFCIRMQCGEYSDCCAAGLDEVFLDTGTRLMKSVDPLPTVVDSRYRDLLLKIGSADGSFAYQVVSETQIRWNYNKYTSKLIKVWIKNNHVFAINLDPAVTTLAVSAVIEQPHLISTYGTCDGQCFSWDDNYPIAEAMIPVITTEILNKEMRITSTTLPDVQNDTNNSRVVQ